jgi:hypothetical protein
MFDSLHEALSGQSFEILNPIQVRGLAVACERSAEAFQQSVMAAGTGSPSARLVAADPAC